MRKIIIGISLIAGFLFVLHAIGLLTLLFFPHIQFEEFKALRTIGVGLLISILLSIVLFFFYWIGDIFDT